MLLGSKRIYHFVRMLHSPAVQLGKSKGHLHPSQVQTTPLRQSIQSTTQPPVTPCTTSTYLTPPEMTTPPHPHMVAHTGMYVTCELPAIQVALFLGPTQLPIAVW